MPAKRIVVIGASAGGVESLCDLVASLPPVVDAAIFVVLHIPANCMSSLPEILQRHGPLKASHAKNGQAIETGRIYVAPPDHHLLVDKRAVIVARGPKENRNRPSIDALFRSAAYAHGSAVIGIVLSGALDDGTSGLWSIKRMGGISIIQDPAEAIFDSMPSSALLQVKIDHCLESRNMGPLIAKLTKKPIRQTARASAGEISRMKQEISIAIDGDAFKKGVMEMGPPTPYTCPECRGVLVKLDGEPVARYRCHTGHAYTDNALLSGIMDRVDASYWDVMRSLEESAMLLGKMGDQLKGVGDKKSARLLQQESRRANEQARRLRESVLSGACFSGDTLLEKARKQIRNQFKTRTSRSK